MITCTIVFQKTAIASARAATRRIAHHDAQRQVSSLPPSGRFAHCQFHFHPDTRIETPAQIIKRFKLKFDDLLPDTDVIYPMNVEECVLEHLYERGAYIGKTDAGIEYCPSQLI